MTEIQYDHPITPREASRQLGIHHITAYRLVHSGALIAFKVGKALRIKQSSVTAFIEKNTVKPKV